MLWLILVLHFEFGRVSLSNRLDAIEHTTSNYGCNAYILQLHKTRTEEDMIMLTVVSDTPSQCSTSTVKFQVEVHVTLTDWDWHDML